MDILKVTDHTGLMQQLLSQGNDPRGYIGASISGDNSGNVLAVALYATKNHKPAILNALRTQADGNFAAMLIRDPDGRDTDTLDAQGNPASMQAMNLAGVDPSDMPSPSDVQRFRWLTGQDMPLPAGLEIKGDQVIDLSTGWMV